MNLIECIAVLLLSSPMEAPAAEVPQYVKIYYQEKELKDGSVKFFMWIKGLDQYDIDGAAHNVYSGYSIGEGSVYIAGDKVTNAMFFVHPYSDKKGPLNNERISYAGIKFGGDRPDDFHIYLPKGFKADVQISRLKYRPPVQADE